MALRPTISPPDRPLSRSAEPAAQRHRHGLLAVLVLPDPVEVAAREKIRHGAQPRDAHARVQVRQPDQVVGARDAAVRHPEVPPFDDSFPVEQQVYVHRAWRPLSLPVPPQGHLDSLAEP